MNGINKVLLIEDNPGDRRLVVEYLRERYGNDCAVLEAGTLAAGLDRLRSGEPDVVLLDLGLPDSVGLATFFAVSNASPSTPIVILTGDDDEDTATQALHQGAEDYLAKRHADSVALIRAMRHAVHRRRAAVPAPAPDERSRTLAETTEEGIAQLDAQGLIRFANPQLARLLLGLRFGSANTDPSPADWIGRRLGDQVEPEDAAVLARLTAARPGERLTAELRLRRPGGEPLWVHAAAGGIASDGGGAPDVLLMLGNIHDHKQALAALQGNADLLETRIAERTEQLQAQNADLAAFNYTVAHDLRTPLHGILGFAALMRMDHENSLAEPQSQRLRVIERTAHGMDDLISSLLQLARLGRQAMRVQRIDLSAMARTIADTLTATAPERVVQWQIDPGLAADGDSTLVGLLLQNLIGNAWKYSGRQDEAVIRVSAMPLPDGQGPAFQVSDNGIGFDMASVGRLFEPFERLPSAQGFGGSGIGLATARRIVERHGGRIWAEGSPGGGAKFAFTLAMSAAHTRPE